jgi:BirA family biotin operon repressor/biotin-[acetyl-CoA-carboxylase] ligase
LLADEQTAGRGRRGRRWHASPGAAIMFSVRWEFDAGATRLGGLSLAVGASVARTLHRLGALDVALKWPNDLLASMATGGAKLGGILIETRSSSTRLAAVIGVGLNFRRMPGLDIRLKRRIASLDESIDPLPARNDVAIALLADLLPSLRLFSREGFAPFKAQWEALHSNQGEAMRVRTSHGRVISGIADGVAPDGALLLRTRQGVQSIHSGSVVRKAELRGATA